VISSTTKVVDFVTSPIAGPSKDLAEVLVNAGTAVARGNGADYAKQFVLNGNIPGEIASHTMPSLMPQTKDGEQARMDKRVVAIQIVGAFLPGPKPGKAVVKEVPSAVKTVAEGVEHCVGGACCFAAGTLIATEAGERPIEDIALGDRVLSRDPNTGEMSMREVVWLKPPLVTGIVRVTVRDEDGHEEDIRTTPEHVFWTENHGWLRVAALTPGDGLSSATGRALIVAAIQQTEKEERVYNFAVDGTHTYFVAHAQVWVHNEGSCASKGKTLAQWLKNEPKLLEEAHQQFKKSPQWQGIDPEKTNVFLRAKEEVAAIRSKVGESGGHHPHGLALGGPEGQTLTQTGETLTIKNPDHSAATGFQKRIINAIRRSGE
jgi:hypothetical protein